MAYNQKQGRDSFPKTGRGITSKLTGPEDPPTEITFPSMKNISYTGKGNKYEYTRTLRDSLQNAGLPTGNLFERGRQAQRAIAYDKDSPTEQDYKTADKIENLISHQKYHTDPRRITSGDGARYATRIKGMTERMLMNVEKQIKKNKKKKN